MKTNANGDSLWSRTFGGSQADECYAVRQTTDGGYVLVGHTSSFGAGSLDIWVVKTDSNGSGLWNRTYGGGGSEQCGSIRQTTDGGYILGGRTSIGAGNGDYWMVKISANGDSLWSRTFGGSNIDEGGNIQQTAEGGYIFGGYTQSFGMGGSDFWLVKTNENGDSLWSRVYGGTQDDACTFVQQTADGGYVWAGYTCSIGAGGYDFWLVKTEPDTSTLCGTLTGMISAANSPYAVICDLLIPAGDTLVIEPGVVLNFMGPYKFEVRGTLLAIGTEEDSIVFSTEQIGTPRWRGLRFGDSTSTGSRIVYCRIEKGYATGTNPDASGGGIFCWNGASPFFANCSIWGNYASDGGGGIYCGYYASPTFLNCTISGDTAGNAGGGIACYALATPNFVDCEISGNRAINEGGGVYLLDRSPASFNRCIILGNHAGQGGGIKTQDSAPLLTNCTISHNTAVSQGGAMYCYYLASPQLRNSIVSFSGGTVAIYWNATATAPVFSDFYGNAGGNFGGTVPPGLGQIVTTNRNGDPCDVYNNIFLNPKFVNAGVGNYHLTGNSPCIDAGDPAMFDPDCTPSDMGAFYFYHLAQPENLVAFPQYPHIRLNWSIVDSTECGFPSPIQSYVIFFEQDLTEDWDFLAATEDTFYVHENVLRFPPPAPLSQYYYVIASDIEIGTLNFLIQPGMSRQQVERILRER
ncbi:right-handed parallel beta-helix repeat-containing protein [bacterium]|nr:right-handed parallel beta-helix repeat-containing protein [bacterium]MBU1983336.1 right-handed parallel beta-helix repeat-containing protein [bacterium]